MYSRLREQFGTAGLVVAIMALVIALAGGAYAASGGGANASKTKVVKGPKGAKGAKGDTGPVGPAGAKGDTGAAGAKGDTGPAGPAGAKGDTGPAGLKGDTGSAGPKGDAGATGGTGPKGDTGATGGTGPKGDTGAPGEPWTAGGTLPSESTETGTWSFTSGTNSNETFAVGELLSVNFTIPLEADIPASNAVSTQFASNPNCPGSAADPKAEPGYFCVYVGSITNARLGFNAIGVPAVINPSSGLGGTGTAGAVLNVWTEEGEPVGYGTWAVTAP